MRKFYDQLFGSHRSSCYYVLSVIYCRKNVKLLDLVLEETRFFTFISNMMLKRQRRAIVCSRCSRKFPVRAKYSKNFIIFQDNNILLILIRKYVLLLLIVNVPLIEKRQ